MYLLKFFFSHFESNGWSILVRNGGKDENEQCFSAQLSLNWGHYYLEKGLTFEHDCQRVTRRSPGLCLWSNGLKPFEVFVISCAQKGKCTLILFCGIVVGMRAHLLIRSDDWWAVIIVLNVELRAGVQESGFSLPTLHTDSQSRSVCPGQSVPH